MATAVRPPGYYTSWLHVVTEIKDTDADQYKNGINLYEWIGNWTAANYGHRWTNASKKLNAILTIPSGVRVTAPFLSTPLNSAPAASSCVPAITIPSDFRDFDRITIINNGTIIGQYGSKSYSGNGSFTPPSLNSSNGVTVTDTVISASLTVAAGGGQGGNNAGSCAGGGGGGGGAGGRATGTYTVLPGVQITANGGGAGQSASYSQAGQGSIISASAGSKGGDGFGGNRGRYCGGFTILGVCFNWFNTCQNGEGGSGGSGGSPGGNDGSKGGSGGYRYDRSGMQRNSGGGNGGAGAGGNGGQGASEPDGNPGQGSAGYHNYSYSRTELYGPALVNYHNNVRITNNGVIAGGYALTPVYAVYGTSLMELAPAGTIIGGSAGGPP